MDDLVLRRRDARRIAILAQRLDAESIATEPGVVETVSAITALPLDWTPTIAPGHDHLLFSRIGGAYDPDDLAHAIEAAELFELDLVIRPIDALPLYRPLQRRYPPPEGRSEWLDDNEPFRADVLERLELDGPLAASEIDDTSIRPWRSTGWTNSKNVAKLLDLLERRGEVAVAAREGVVRRFDLAERVRPAHGPGVAELPDAEAAAERDRRLLRGRGISRPGIPGTEFEPRHAIDAGVPARVEGVRGRWLVDEDALARLDGFEGRTALVNPLDRLVFDRTRLLELFETEYTLEMYKPKAQRRWGYFALPILHGDRIVGKLDATVEREAGRLRIDALHEDEPFSAATERAVHGAIAELADWLGVAVVRS